MGGEALIRNEKKLQQKRVERKKKKKKKQSKRGKKQKRTKESYKYRTDSIFTAPLHVDSSSGHV
jgi:hypothetical protein